MNELNETNDAPDEKTLSPIQAGPTGTAVKADGPKPWTRLKNMSADELAAHAERRRERERLSYRKKIASMNETELAAHADKRRETARLSYRKKIASMDEEERAANKARRHAYYLERREYFLARQRERNDKKTPPELREARREYNDFKHALQQVRVLEQTFKYRPELGDYFWDLGRHLEYETEKRNEKVEIIKLEMRNEKLEIKDAHELTRAL